MDERQEQIERICQRALDLQGAARLEYLSEACQDNAGLRREVESLLAQEGAAEPFIEAPAIEHVARTLAVSGTLHVGGRIGPYEIVSVLGSGGMGEVYRARDTRLKRDVALKILPVSFATDAERLSRFQREAEVLASLNHPHIAGIYGLEESDSIRALVLELVGGETLEERIARGPIRVHEALPLARQIALALEVAHQRGIVHRDLKPANIKVTPDSTAKVLDFGLAKLAERGDSPYEVEESVTAMSLPGVVIGTPVYMSPEQARGEEVDQRTDIWAFGCVLFEMLTGRRAIGGRGTAETLANVLTSTPDWSLLPPDLPAAVRQLLQRCLEKDRVRRLSDISAATLAMADVRAPANQRTRRETAAESLLPWIGGLAVAITAVVFLVRWAPWQQPQPRLVRFSIDVPGMGDAFFMSLSPDGSQIVYPAMTPSGRMGLWIRRLDSLNARLLPGTEGAFVSDWSPDSRFIVFLVDQQLKKIDVTGGPPQTLTKIQADTRRATWNRDGVILFAGSGPTIRRIADTGGESAEVTQLDAALQETAHSTPWFLPDGRRFLYTAWSTNPENRAIYVGSLDSPTRIRLMPADSKAMYSPPGFIVFRREGTLMARPFDAKRLAFTGEAKPIAESVRFNPALGQSAFYASEEGTLAYVADEPVDVRLLWMDRGGRKQEIGSAVSGALNPTLSLDGRRIAFHTNVPSDVWTYDIERQQIARITNHAAEDAFPLFSRDGRRLVFASNRENLLRGGLYEQPSDGAVSERTILVPEPGGAMIPRDWDPEGRHLIFEKGGGFGTPRDIWMLPLSAGGKPLPYAESPADERHPALSPDGRWLAYTSNESDSFQIIVQAFPDPAGGKFTIASGRFPRWRRDGRELYFVDSTTLVALSVRTEPTFKVLGTTRLFEVPFVPGINELTIPYDVTADGQRFLVTARTQPASTSTATEIRMVLGWQSLLGQ